MMKLVLLVAACVFGTVLCETHDQQKKYANLLVQDMESAVENMKEMLHYYDIHSPEGKRLLFIHANSFNFNVHYVLDSLQHAIAKNKGQPGNLQEIVLQLNNITYELEKTFKNGPGPVKNQLEASAENMKMVAKHLRDLIDQSEDQYYSGIVLRFLDDLVSSTQMANVRDSIRRKTKNVVKSIIRVAKKLLTGTLDSITSSNENVYDDIFVYSSKFSSAVSETRTLLRDLTFTYGTRNEEEVKDIIYSLSKIVRENDEVLFNENTFDKVKEQFGVAIEDLAAQLDKVVDAGYSDEHTMEDENMIYVVLPYILTHATQLQRNFEKTIEDYIKPQSDY